jgi:hypothetical protein
VAGSERHEVAIPQFFIEASTGIGDEAKQRMLKEITAAIYHAYHIPDVRIWLREWSANNVAQDGRLNAEPMRPLCFLEAPELSNLDVKQKMAERIDAAIAKAYAGLANTDQTLILMSHYPLENAAAAGRLQSDNPELARG